ncbi:hypothetical protein [Gimesia panareensis]|nr:hypothetical protein [Gimesia panareensis]
MILFLLKTILACVAIFVIGIVLALVAGILKLRKIAAQQWDEFEETMAQGGYAPPMRLNLSPTKKLSWSDSDHIAKIISTLKSVGYEPDGQFDTANPFRTLVQGFRHNALPGYAVLCEDEYYKTTWVDLFAQLPDDRLVRVTTSPDDGLDSPDFIHLIRNEDTDLSEPDQIRKLHQLLLDHIDDHSTQAPSENAFENFYRNSWARIMDWRMERGGITTEEAIRIAKMKGTSEPAEADIERSKHPWKKEIDEYISNKIRKDYLWRTELTKKQKEDIHDRLVVVHERSEPARLASIMADIINDDNEQNSDHEADSSSIENQFKEYFISDKSLIEGFRQAMAQIPREKQFALQGSTESPWKSEIYLSPKYYDEY